MLQALHAKAQVSDGELEVDQSKTDLYKALAIRTKHMLDNFGIADLVDMVSDRCQFDCANSLERYGDKNNESASDIATVDVGSWDEQNIDGAVQLGEGEEALSHVHLLGFSGLDSLEIIVHLNAVESALHLR